MDGVNVKNYSHQELNNKVGYIPQKAVLFSGTIRSNMEFGESSQGKLEDEAIWKALELAQAKEFVAAKEKGLDTEVAQGGSNFSGGQRQRLAIARALARKPEILIFDDSFSALDYKTDRILRQALKEELADTTRLIVAQRISTIMDADLILVLDQGKVVGQGTHKELLATNEVYQEIAYSQLSKEELNMHKNKNKNRPFGDNFLLFEGLPLFEGLHKGMEVLFSKIAILSFRSYRVLSRLLERCAMPL